MMKLLLIFLSVLQSTLLGQFYVGMETAHIKRMRDGGTQQNGRMDGVRICYDRLKRFYLGAEYFYGSANLPGHSGGQAPIFSVLTDESYEGRIGYSFLAPGHFFSLFTGYGYFHEINDFFPPTALPLKFTNTFNYIPVGFLSGVYLSSLLSMGFNFKIMFMQNAKTEVTNDPFRADSTLYMQEEINVRLELPFIFSPPNTRLRLQFGVTPFYEYRHYGGRAGYPNNYLDTKFNLLGARFALVANY